MATSFFPFFFFSSSLTSQTAAASQLRGSTSRGATAVGHLTATFGTKILSQFKTQPTNERRPPKLKFGFFWVKEKIGANDPVRAKAGPVDDADGRPPRRSRCSNCCEPVRTQPRALKAAGPGCRGAQHSFCARDSVQFSGCAQLLSFSSISAISLHT